MSEILRKTDLTKLEGDPGARATWRHRQERCRFEFRAPTWLGGFTMKLDARTDKGSHLSTAITTVLLAIVGCAAMGVSILAGAPAWLVFVSFLAPAAIFLTIRLTLRQVK
jgi:hypothetical protein